MNPSTYVERRTLLEAICADPKLTGSALRFAMVAMACVNNDSGACFPSQRAIRYCCHLSRNTIETQARALEERGWLWIERGESDDGEANRYHFAFHRVRDGGDRYGFSLLSLVAEYRKKRGAARAPAPIAELPNPEVQREHVGGSISEPPAGSISEPPLAQNLKSRGSNSEPELTEYNSQDGTQESLFGQGGLPEAPPFDFEAWFENQWWPQYPLKVEKGAIAESW